MPSNIQETDLNNQILDANVEVSTTDVQNQLAADGQDNTITDSSRVRVGGIAYGLGSLSAVNLGNKFDSSDIHLETVLKNNRTWAHAVQTENPNFFKELSKRQEPKILWIGCSDSRVPANQLIQLGPGEVFVHRNIANVVSHTDLNCLSVVQYAVEVLKVEHIIVCGHYNCGGVSASLHNQQYGLIDTWLMNIKDVYRRHKEEFESIKDDTARERKLVELNVHNSVNNVCHTTIVQNAWKRGQQLAVHGWAYDLETGLINQLDICVRESGNLEQVFRF